MLRRPHPPLVLALAGFAALVVTGVLAKLVPITERGDASSLEGFIGFNRPRLTPLIASVAHLADPRPYALVGIALAAIAVARGRHRVALAIPVLFVVTGATTRALKHGLGSPRVEAWLPIDRIADASWPSGHSTAAMTMALCAVLAAPPRLRPTVAVLGGGFAIAVGYSVLALSWHFPSDVVGGYLVAGSFVLLALAVLAFAQERRPARAPRAEAPPRAVDVLPALGLAAVAGGGALGIALTRRHALLDYAQGHTTTVAVAAAIALLALMLAALVGLGFRGAGNAAAAGPAADGCPRAARGSSPVAPRRG